MSLNSFYAQRLDLLDERVIDILYLIYSFYDRIHLSIKKKLGKPEGMLSLESESVSHKYF